MLKTNNFTNLFLVTLLLFSIQAQANPKVDRRYAQQQSYSRASMVKLKNEVLTSFTLYGQPISPLAIREFIPWESDLLSPITAIDLNATVDSNRYCGTFHLNDKNIIAQSPCDSNDIKDQVAYRVLGRIGNDNIVVNSFTQSRLSDLVVMVLHISLQRIAWVNKPFATSPYQYTVVAQPLIKIPVNGLAKLQGNKLVYKAEKNKPRTVDLLKLIQQSN